MRIAISQVGRKNRRRGKASPFAGLALAGGPSGENMTWLGRPPRGEVGDFIDQGVLPVTPGSREGRFYHHTPAAQEEHTYQGIRAVKSEGASGDHSQLVVEAFDEAVGEPGFDIGEDAVFVFADSLCGCNERPEFGSGGPGEPTVQLLSGLVLGGFVEDGGEGFLEQVGAVEGGVVLLDSGELVPLLGGEIPGILEQGVSGFLYRGGFFGVVEFLEITDHLPSYFVDGVGGELLHVESIEDDLCLWCFGLDGLDECGGHVDGDAFEQGGALLPQLVEKGVEGLGAFPLGGPDNTFGVVVDDGGDVFVPLAKAELVDAYVPELVEPFGVEFVGDDALYDVSHGAPGDAHHTRYLGLVGDLGEVCGHLLEGSCEATPRPSPRDQLHADSAVGTLHASRGVLEDEPHRADAEVDPSDRLVAMVVAGAYPPALGASRQTPGGFHRKNDTGVTKVDTGDEKAGYTDKDSGKLGDAHCSPPLSGVLVDTRKHGKPCAFQFLGAERRKLRRGVGQVARRWPRLPTLDAGEPYY